MLLLGLFFLAWARLRPLRVEGLSAIARAEETAAGRAEAGPDHVDDRETDGRRAKGDDRDPHHP